MTLLLTRYLYDKSAILFSFQCAIREKDTKQALFWAYELYYSGYQTEIIDIVLSMYNATLFPKLYKCLQKKYEQWKKENNAYPTFLAVLIVNLVRTMRITMEKSPVLIIIVKEADIEPYKTKPIDASKPWQYLRNCCEYAVKVPTEMLGHQADASYREQRNAEGNAQSNAKNFFQSFSSQTQWLYYAYPCPLWNLRLSEFNVKSDHVKKDVEFDTEEAMEDFMAKYGFEPDEQPLAIQTACVGTF